MKSLLASARTHLPLSQLRTGPPAYPEPEKVPSNILTRPVKLSPMRRVKG